MTGLECLKEEMKRRGLNQAQCDSKVAAVVLDILSESGTQFTKEWQDRKDLEDAWRAVEKERRSIEREKNGLLCDEVRFGKARKEIEDYAKNVQDYVERFCAGLAECETDEGRDAMKRAQMFVNTVDPKTAYDNTAFIIGLASILSSGKTATIDELRKINKKIPGIDEGGNLWTRI